MIPKVSQEVLAEMVATTRPRISGFMNKFRKLGFIEYNGGLHIHSSPPQRPPAWVSHQRHKRRQLLADSAQAQVCPWILRGESGSRP